MSEDNYLQDPRRNTIEGWLVAFGIFAKYLDLDSKQNFEMAAEHDILYLPNAPAPKSNEEVEGEEVLDWGDAAEDARVLTGLGFHYDNEEECWAKFT